MANQECVWTPRGLKLILHHSGCILLRRSEVEAEEKIGNTEKAKGKTDQRMKKMRVREKDVQRAEYIGYTISETSCLIALGVWAWGPVCHETHEFL